MICVCQSVSLFAWLRDRLQGAMISLFYRVKLISVNKFRNRRVIHSALWYSFKAQFLKAILYHIIRTPIPVLLYSPCYYGRQMISRLGR